ncbi:protein slowmo homolog isoform X2, partial [Tanacetum coccineum]
MIRAYSQEHIYKHPWERVTSASWQKFADPKNKHTLSHTLKADNLNHKLNPEEGKLYTTHAITIHALVPWFLRKIVGQDIFYCVESTIDDLSTSSTMPINRPNIIFVCSTSGNKYLSFSMSKCYDAIANASI